MGIAVRPCSHELNRRICNRSVSLRLHFAQLRAPCRCACTPLARTRLLARSLGARAGTLVRRYAHSDCRRRCRLERGLTRQAQEDQYIIQHEKEKLEKRTCGCECECRCTNLGQSVSRCTSSRSLSTTYVYPAYKARMKPSTNIHAQLSKQEKSESKP